MFLNVLSPTYCNFALSLVERWKWSGHLSLLQLFMLEELGYVNCGLCPAPPLPFPGPFLQTEWQQDGKRRRGTVSAWSRGLGVTQGKDCGVTVSQKEGCGFPENGLGPHN